MAWGEIIGYVGTAIGAGGITQLVNWKLNRSKAREEVKSDEIDNIKKSVEVYQTIIADQNKRITELTEEVNGLREQLRNERGEYQRQIDSLQKQIIAITRVLGIQSNQRIRAAQLAKEPKKKE